MGFLNSKTWAYISFALAIVAYSLGFFEIIAMTTATAIMVAFGFTGLAALRLYIKSKGWKSYGVIIFFGIPAVLSAFNIIPAEWFEKIFALGMSLLGLSLTAANKKVQEE